MDNDAAVNRLGALAHKSRLEIFRLLVQAGPKGMSVGEIGQRLGIPGATLAHHLNQLKHSGLLLSRQENRYIYHAANFQGVRELVGYLMANCCEGQPACDVPGSDTPCC